MLKYRYLKAKITPLEQEKNPEIRALYQGALKRDDRRKKMIYKRTVKYLLKRERFQTKQHKISLAPHEDDNLIIRRAKEMILDVRKLLDAEKAMEKTTVGTNTQPNQKKRKASLSASTIQKAKRAKVQKSFSTESNEPDELDKPAATLLHSLNAAVSCTKEVHVKTDLTSGTLSCGTAVSPELLQETVAEDHPKVNNEEMVFTFPKSHHMDMSLTPCSSPPVQPTTSSSNVLKISNPVTELVHPDVASVFPTEKSRQAEFVPYSNCLKGPIKHKKGKSKDSPLRTKKSAVKMSPIKNPLTLPTSGRKNSIGIPQKKPPPLQNSHPLTQVPNWLSNIPQFLRPTYQTNNSDFDAHHKIQPLTLGRAPKSKLWQALCTQRSHPPHYPHLMMQAKKNAAAVSNHQKQRPARSLDDVM